MLLLVIRMLLSLNSNQKAKRKVIRKRILTQVMLEKLLVCSDSGGEKKKKKKKCYKKIICRNPLKTAPDSTRNPTQVWVFNTHNATGDKKVLFMRIQSESEVVLVR